MAHSYTASSMSKPLCYFNRTRSRWTCHTSVSMVSGLSCSSLSLTKTLQNVGKSSLTRPQHVLNTIQWSPLGRLLQTLILWKCMQRHLPSSLSSVQRRQESQFASTIFMETALWVLPLTWTTNSCKVGYIPPDRVENTLPTWFHRLGTLSPRIFRSRPWMGVALSLHSSPVWSSLPPQY